MDSVMGWAGRNRPLVVVQLNIQWIPVFLKGSASFIAAKQIACATS